MSYGPLYFLAFLPCQQISQKAVRARASRLREFIDNDE